MSANGCALADPYRATLAELLLRAVDASTQVRRRHQFFTWLQSHLQNFLPHRVALCGAYDRTTRIVQFDVYNVVPIAVGLLPLLRDERSPLMADITMQWIEKGGRCIEAEVSRAARLVGPELCAALVNAGLDHLAVHGVARPHRPREIESLFVLASRDAAPWSDEQLLSFEMLLPHVHTTYMRVLVLERELGSTTPAAKKSGRLPTDEHSALVTEREREILTWVRDGKSNVEIGQVLGISGLTVKNHVQKILRKLGASNRAQAVARAIAIRLIPSDQARR